MGLALGLGLIVLGNVERAELLLAHVDASAPSVQSAIQGDLSGTAQDDGAPRIDLDQRTAPQLQRLAGGIELPEDIAVAACLQVQVRPFALDQASGQGILQVQRRCPGLQRLSRRLASRDLAGPAGETVDRPRDPHLGILGYRQSGATDHPVAGEALLEEIFGQLQAAIPEVVAADPHLAALQRQRAGAARAETIQCAAQLQLAIAGLRQPGTGVQGDVAAATAQSLAVGQQRRPGRHVEQTALSQAQVAAAAQGNPSAVAVGQRIVVLRRQQQVAPQAAGIQPYAVAHAQDAVFAAGIDETIDRPVRRNLRQHVAGLQAAAMGGDVGVDRHVVGEQDRLAAIGQGQRAVDADALAGRHLQAAQLEAVEQFAVQAQAALALGGHRSVQGRLLGRHLAGTDDHLLEAAGIGAESVLQQAAALHVVGGVAPDDQLRAARHGILRLVVAVQAGLWRFGLPLAAIGIADHLAVEPRIGAADHQTAGVAADDVAVLVALGRRDQRIVEITGLVPALAVCLVAAVDAVVEQVARRRPEFVEASVRALQPGLADVAALHIEGSAGQVDLRTGLGHHVVAGETDDAALGHPLARRVALGAQVATDLQQAAGGVPAVAGIAVGAGRHPYQVAHVDPHILAVQTAALAVDRGVALLVAAHVDLDAVGLHRHLHTLRAGDIDHRAVAQQGALASVDRHLAAAGEGDGAVAEIDAAGGVDLHPRQVAAVVVAPTDSGTGAVQRLEQGLALAVEGGAAAAIHQDRAGGAFGQGDPLAGLQVQGAAAVHRTAGKQYTGLLHLAAGEADIAGGGLHQAAVAYPAGTAVGGEARQHLVAAGGGGQVAVGALATADDEAVAGGQDRLPLRCDDAAGVVHLAAEQQDVAAAPGRAGRRCRTQLCPLLHAHGAGRVGEGRTAAGVVVVEAALTELFVRDVRRRHRQVAHVHLAAAGKHHAVAVDQHHRAVGLDLPLDLAGPRAGVVDPVEQRPVGVLLEVHGGVAADVEGFPVEHRLVGGLLDAHRGLAGGLGLHRSLGVLPGLLERQRGVDLEAALAEPVRNILREVQRRLASGGLGGLLGGNGGDGVVQVGHRTLQLLVDPLLLRQRRRRPRQLRSRSRRPGSAALSRALGGEPGGAERLPGGLGAPCDQQQGDGLGQRLQARRVKRAGGTGGRRRTGRHGEGVLEHEVGRAPATTPVTGRRPGGGWAEDLSWKVHGAERGAWANGNTTAAGFQPPS